MDQRIVSALIGASVAALSILIKDYILDLVKEKRRTKQSKYQTFKLYANPIIRASESLCWRLKEIFEQRGSFLLEEKPRNTFFEYKYISTLYRLSVLIGWIRAIYREFAYIDTSDSRGNREIENSFNLFRKALADGQHTELSMLKELASCWELNLDTLSNEEKAKLAVSIEDTAYNYIQDYKLVLHKDLKESKQIELLTKISTLITNKLDVPPISDVSIKRKRIESINEITRIENWVYRDWQDAIGDLMLKEIEKSPRRFDTIGFAEFDELIDNNNKWLDRIEKLFNNLNVDVDDRFDARVGQLKRVYNATIDILSAFNEFNKKQETISQKSIDILKNYNYKLNAI